MTADRFAEIKRTVGEGMACLLPEPDIRWLVGEVERLSRAGTHIPVAPNHTISHLLARFDEAESPAVLSIAVGDACRLFTLTEITPIGGANQ